MERLSRFIKAVDYLKTKADEPTNEAVSRLLKYKTENYISDVIGGSKPISKFLLERMVEFSINEDWIETGKGKMLIEPKPGPSAVNEDPAIYNTVLPLGDLKVTLKDYLDLLKENKKKAEEAILKAEQREQRLMALLEKDIKTIKSNSETIQADLEVLTVIVRSDDEVLLKGTDRVLGREEGASSQEAYIGERAFLDSGKESHMTDSKGKQGNSGTKRRQRKA
jgi:hypothetical protein